MKARNKTQENPVAVKRKMLAAVSMLLLSGLLLAIVSFAWLTMSIAPEIRGVSTNIGANGSLEIALLNSQTKQDLSTIKTSVGQSLDGGSAAANNTWGNLLDLNDESYGLSEIMLLPARLNAVKQADGTYTLNSGILAVPTYGYDGRIVELTKNTFGATYKDSNFTYNPNNQEYGVRAIGTSNTVSVQSAALALAKTYITSYKNNANTSSGMVLKNNGDTLVGIIVKYQANKSDATFTDSDIDNIKKMVNDVDVAISYIDLALRQGVIAYAAAQISDDALFNSTRDKVMNTNTKLSEIISEENFAVDLPEEFTTWTSRYNSLKNSVNNAFNMSNSLSGGSYSWAQVRGILDNIINFDYVLIGEKYFSQMSSADISSMLSGSVKMTLAPNSGVFADIADFAGNMSTWMSAMGAQVEVVTVSAQNPSFIDSLINGVGSLTASEGNNTGDVTMNLTTTYGYAIDMAFRCNAPMSDLLLQTDALQRIYENSSSVSTMGGGSFMSFSTADQNFTIEQSLKLMDAVRVAFVDDQNTILGIAKLNVSNRVIENDEIKAPLYLYDFSISESEEDNGALIMGERNKIDNTITALEQSVAKAVTVVVWLDGDIVDNTMVSAESETSLNGVLNLQFASSADLVPANNSDLLYLTPDKEGITALIEEHKATYEAGQGFYTTVSWNTFAKAYDYAVLVNESVSSNEPLIYRAMVSLTKAAQGLELTSLDVLKEAIDEIRGKMGTTDEVARYVYKDEANKTFYSSSEYTQEMADSRVGDIYKVDYNNNLKDEGSGVMTRIYTDASWSSLAAALYDAEVLYYYNEYTNIAKMDAAISALKAADDALVRTVFYIPYDYNGALYYKAISNDPDTYGKWYYSNFTKVVSDIRILELDAYATEVQIAEIALDSYISNATDEIIMPTVQINNKFYSSLKEEILAVHWANTEFFKYLMTSEQIFTISALIEEAKTLEVDVETISAAEALLEDNYATDEEAEAMIIALSEKIQEKKGAMTPEEDGGAVEGMNEVVTNPAYMTSEQRYLITLALSSVNAHKDSIIAELNATITEIENAIAYDDVTVNEADEILAKINAELAKYGLTVAAIDDEATDSTDTEEVSTLEEETTEEETTTAVQYMTNEQKAAIEAAVATLRAYISTVEAQFAEVIDAATNVITSVELVTYDNAEAALDSLNTTLRENGLKEVTAYNSIIHSLGTDIFEVTHNIDFVNTLLSASGVTGQTELVAIVLTKNGVLTTVTKKVTVYKPAEDVLIYNERNPEGVTEISLNAGQKTIVSASLIEELLAGEIGEHVSRYVWSTSDMKKVSLENETSGSCTLTAVANGTVTVSVTIVTVEGNQYTKSVQVTVN